MVFVFRSVDKIAVLVGFICVQLGYCVTPMCLIYWLSKVIFRLYAECNLLAFCEYANLVLVLKNYSLKFLIMYGIFPVLRQR